MKIFDLLEKVKERPKPFEFYTAEELWTDSHTSGQMLKYHLDKYVDAASRNHGFIKRSVEWIDERIGLPGKKVIDFGCGPGLYTTRFAKHGAIVTGLDFSQRSLEYAKETADKEKLQIKYIKTNYLDYSSSEKYDMITMIMCDYCALSPDQRKKLLSRFSTLLKKDGRVLFDVYSLTAFDDYGEKMLFEENLLNGFWSSSKYYGFQNNIKYNDEKVTLDKYTIIDSKCVRTIYNWLQYYSLESIRDELNHAGFDIREIYSNVAGDKYDSESGEFAIIAVLQD